MILEHYIALNEKNENMNTVYLKQLTRVKKHIRKKFKNRIIYKMSQTSEDKYIDELWNILEDYIKCDETVVEIYSCYKNQEDENIRETIVLNRGEHKPSLKHNRYIVLGNFISGEVLQPRKTFIEQDKGVHILSLYKDDKNLYMDMIMGCCEKVSWSGNHKSSTRREEILKRIEYAAKPLQDKNNHNVQLSIEPQIDIESITFNDTKFNCFLASHTFYYKNEHKNHGFYDNMLFKYYYDRNRIPDEIRNKDFMICRVKMMDSIISNPINTVELKLIDKTVDYPIETSFSLTLGEFEKGKFIEYLSPIDNNNHKVYIDSLEIYDPYEEVRKELKDEFKNAMEEETKLLIMTYENPDNNIDMNFYLKSILDLSVKKNTNDWGISLSNERGKNGHKVRVALLDQLTDLCKDKMEIELLYITRRLNGDSIKFTLNEKLTESLCDYIIVEREDINIWARIEEDYKCIRFTPEPITYCPKKHIIDETDMEYEKVNIPLGKSRIGGPVVDLPRDIQYPEDLFFTAQINLKEFKDYFFNDYLPKEGFLYVFVGGYGDYGRVIYSNCETKDLKRVVKEHGDWFYSGNLIKDVYIEDENISERYDKEWAKDGEKMGWNPFAGTEKSKIYGIYTNCQYEEEELKEELLEDKILLLQIGEDFNGEGILSVRIDKNDLEKRDFSNCIFEWSQS